MTAEDQARAVEIELLPRDAGDDVVAEVTDLVNRVYAIAEEGLWRDGTARTMPSEIKEFIRSGEIAVARLDGRIVGCVRIQRLDGGVGEFGMLAADPGHRAIGVGRLLVRFAERLTYERGFETMQLELLVPQTWTHPTKKFLQDWYTRLGYRAVRTGSIDGQYPALAPRLATPCDFVIYHKELPRAETEAGPAGRGTDRREGHRRSEELQVIGVGMHRTGSMSVKAALERLGFGPCYHGMEALRRCTDGEHWLAAYEAGGGVDWPVIFEGYRATLDWPTIYFWEQLATAYPDAKILLTERDPERWWDSHVEMFQLGAEFDRELTGEQRQWAEESGFARMQTALATIASAAFDGRVFDKAHCLRAFEQHYERVRRTVPAERLLVYRVQEGWEPLCRFLGVDVPDEPFPRVNAGGNLLHNIRTAMRLAREQTGEVAWR